MHHALEPNAALARIKRVLKVKTDKQLATELDIPASTMNHLKKRGQLPLRALVEYCVAFDLSLDELILGKAPCNKNQTGAL